MKTLFYILFIVLGLTFLVQPSQAANYYFSTELGNDSRSFMEAQDPKTPWKSIQKLNEIFNTLKPGDQVLFRRGEKFFGSININQSGSVGSPIVIGAYGEGEKPIITSMVQITDWEAKGNNLFEAPVESFSEMINVLTIDGTPFAMGRYPNASEENGGYLTISSHNNNDAVKSQELNSFPDFTGGEIVIRKKRWTIDRLNITSQSGNEISFNPSGGTYSPSVGYGFFIQNHPQTLDQEGEWYFDKINRKILLFSNEGLVSTEKIELATLDRLLKVNPMSSSILVQDLIFLGANENNIEISQSSDISIVDCELRYSGINSIESIKGLNLLIENSIIEDSYSGAIFLRGNRNYTIRNNQIHRTQIFPGMGGNGNGRGVAISTDHLAHNGLIEGNTIVKTGYVGINLNGDNTVIRNNFIDTFCFIKDDGGGIYTHVGSLQYDFTNREISENIIINGVGAVEGTPDFNKKNNGAAEGIYIDDNSSGIEISGNSISKISNNGIFVHNASNLSINKNKIYDTSQGISFIHDNSGNPIRNIKVNSNEILLNNFDEYFVRIRSKLNDLSEMGDFNYNYYSNPFNNANTISVGMPDSLNRMLIQNINLKQWSNLFQVDRESTGSPIFLSYFFIKDRIGNNKFLNNDFDSKLEGIGCWSPNSNCNFTIENSEFLDGNALKGFFPDKGFLIVDVKEIKLGSKYNLKFSAFSKQSMTLKVFLRKKDSPYQRISDVKYLSVSDLEDEVNELFLSEGSEENAVLILEPQDSEAEFWIDNLYLEEVTGEFVDREEMVIFEYNDSSSKKSIKLDGVYLDLKSNIHSGNILIEPYSSVLLIKVPEEKLSLFPVPISTLELTNPLDNTIWREGEQVSIDVKIDVGDINDIEKINYYFCETLIATKSEDPFTCTWKNIPFGRHYLHVEALDKYGRAITSDSIFVEVKKPNEAPIIYLDMPFENTNIFAGESLQIKGSAMDLDGEIEQIEFFANNGRIGRTEKSPFDFSWEAVPQGTYVLTVKVTDNEGLENVSDPLKISVEQNNSLFPDERILSESNGLFFNLGSFAEVSMVSRTFKGEEAIVGYIKGKTLSFTDSSSFGAPLFWTERFGTEFTIAIPVPNGTYTVNTYHNELWFGKGGPEAKFGQRVYDIILQQEAVKEKFDLFLENDNQPTVLTFEQIEVTNGVLELGLKAYANNASISGFAISQNDIEPVLRLKAGQLSDVVYNGDTFESDLKFKEYYGNSSTYSHTKASDQPLFQSERNGSVLSYAIPLPNGIYTVKTYHHELYFGLLGPSAGAGRRVFDITLENQTVKKEFDLFVESQNRPTVLTFEQIAVTDGVLNIGMVASSNRATVSAISIYENEVDLTHTAGEDFTLFVNTGSQSDELFDGSVFSSEANLEGGVYNTDSWTYSNGNASDERLFQTERNSGKLNYRIPVPDGVYTVYTMHNELYFGYAGPSSRAGRRVFDISVEGKLVKNGFDIFSENGNKPTVLEFIDIQVSDGFLDLELLARQNRATLSGIAIVRNGKGGSIKGAENREAIGSEVFRIEKEQPILNEAIRVFPNPARNEVTVELGVDITEGGILIHNMAGQLVKHFDLNSLPRNNKGCTVSLDAISQGVYLLSVFDGLKLVERKKLIVVK
ncbi:malectin domain-containing carbohydrate-binding protein [Cyclobacterium roseum]|uniref:malectin domain-containing carbohydrate-binding protein n=1 Tax=Cyclobacterium roseum TaxID=2666137 RepID=UPI0013907279|nr:malectin domain-containing carbohydrate-binding protein [Cyclobacterium roseum]